MLFNPSKIKPDPAQCERQPCRKKTGRNWKNRPGPKSNKRRYKPLACTKPSGTNFIRLGKRRFRKSFDPFRFEHLWLCHHDLCVKTFYIKRKFSPKTRSKWFFSTLLSTVSFGKNFFFILWVIGHAWKHRVMMIVHENHIYCCTRVIKKGVTVFWSGQARFSFSTINGNGENLQFYFCKRYSSLPRRKTSSNRQILICVLYIALSSLGFIFCIFWFV